MSSALIDNSTLTSIQRLSGTAPAPRSYDAQGDYAAFEALAATLMFNDAFYYIDDYKEEFRELRATEFRFARAIGIDAFPYAQVEAHAKELTDGLLLDIRAGRMQTGVIKQFLETIGLHLTAAWHMQSSDFFLTLKILADEPNDWDTRYKYSPLSALIFDQALGREVEASDATMCLVGSDGKRVEDREENKRKYAVGGDIRAFAASLNWMTWRTAFYALAASHFGALVSLHPIRHTFLSRWSEDRNILAGADNWRRTFANFFGTQASETVNRINEHAESTEIGLHLPLFAAWAVGRAGNVQDAMSFLLDVRIEPDAVVIRQKMAEIDEHRSSRSNPNWKAEVNRLGLAVSAESAALIKKFGVDSGTAPVVSINAELGVPPKLSFGVEAEVGDIGLKFGTARRVRGLFRNIVNDVVGFDSLGAVRSTLLKQVHTADDRTIPALPIEERRYAGRRSDWKQPM